MQVKAKAAAPKPQAGHKTTSAASGPAKSSSAAARTAQVHVDTAGACTHDAPRLHRMLDAEALALDSQLG